MATFTKPSTVERNGYTNFQTLGNHVIADLIDRGFDLVFPDPEFGVNSNTFVATLKPRIPNINPFSPDVLAASQPWHIRIDCSGVVTETDPGYIKINVSHPLQLASDGTVVEESSSFAGDNVTRNYIRTSGEITSGWFLPSETSTGPSGVAITEEGSYAVPFVSRFWNTHNLDLVTNADVNAKTYSYRMTVSFQGMALVVWEEGQDSVGKNFSWIVVQRPVSPANGAVLQTGKAPVFCLYSIGGGEPNNPNTSILQTKNPFARTHVDYDNNAAIYRFTVRELDVYKPTIPVLATVDSPDNRIVINAKQQVAITEGNKYVVSFPNGFNTARYMYREEIDLITYTSADVISQYSNIAVSVYGEDDSRQYKAMQANLPDNTGMRILILTYGPGFDLPT